MLNQINQYSGLADWITATAAVLALVFGAKEYLMKRRPYIDIEIVVADNPNNMQGGWLFFAKLVNKGTYPGLAKVTKTVMRVGDEVYPSNVKTKFILTPGESKKSTLIGSIYKTGISKIINHEYRRNRVEIEICVNSTEIGSNKMKYSSRVVYEVDVKNEKPGLFLVKENFS